MQTAAAQHARAVRNGIQQQGEAYGGGMRQWDSQLKKAYEQ